MHKINIKPLSVNKAWQGKRFKTKDYLYYEKIMLKLLPDELPNLHSIKTSDIVIKIEFGFSNSRSDIDNGLKPFLDILQKKYKFDDCQIVKLNVEKVKVKKSEEYIKFEIIQL